MKALGNWRAKFKAEPRPLEPKLLYRRRGLSHRLNYTLSHMTYGSPEPGPIVPLARQGHRRRFSDAEKRQIVETTVQPGATFPRWRAAMGSRRVFCSGGSRS